MGKYKQKRELYERMNVPEAQTEGFVHHYRVSYGVNTYTVQGYWLGMDCEGLERNAVQVGSVRCSSLFYYVRFGSVRSGWVGSG